MELIKETLKKLHEVSIQLVQLTTLASEKTAKAKEVQTESVARLSNVEVREKEVTVKEGLIRSAEKLEEEQSAATETKTQLVNERKAFDRKCSARTAEIDQMKADIEAPTKDLERREKVLAEDKRTYKEKILSKIGSKGGN